MTSDPIRRRRTFVAFAAACAALIGSTGTLAGSLIQSPEQQRANAAPPSPSTLTAPVQRRVLANTLVIRGTVVPAKRIEVTPVVTGVTAQVVTGTYVKIGSEVRPGDVLLAVSGRPLIALAGKIPAYRDLRPGTNGDDVKQLQEALKQLKHYRGGDRAGHFGTRTKAAVRSLYKRLRYDVPDTGGPGGVGDETALTAADDAVNAARYAIEEMNRRIAAGETAGTGQEPLDAQLARLTTQLSRAETSLDALIARTGPMMPLAEFVFLPTFPARVMAMSTPAGDVVKAPLITLAVGNLAVLAKLNIDEAALIKPGMAARLTAETLAEDSEGAVAVIGEQTLDTAGDFGGSPYRPITITGVRQIPPTWADLDVRVAITAAQTSEPVLVVPLSAVSAGADGRTTVSVKFPDGRTERVEIHAGMSGDGFVQVTAVDIDALREGDEVIVSAVP